MKYEVGEDVIVRDRSMKTNSFKGVVTGIEPNTDVAVYNVLVEMRDKDDELTGKFRSINFLEHQITKYIEEKNV